MTDKTKFQWWVPISYQAEQAKCEIRKAFTPGAILRIVLFFAAVFLAVAYLLPQRVPHFEFDWVAAFVKCLGMLVVILAMCCALAFIPPMVVVTSKGLLVSQGQSSRLYRYTELAELRIDLTSSAYPTLLFRLRSQQTPKLYPIASKIVLDELRWFIDKQISSTKCTTRSMECMPLSAASLISDASPKRDAQTKT